METLPVLRSDAAILLNSIRSSLAQIKKLPPDYDFHLEAISAANYASVQSLIEKVVRIF
jgi:hypothetical protein